MQEPIVKINPDISIFVCLRSSISNLSCDHYTFSLRFHSDNIRLVIWWEVVTDVILHAIDIRVKPHERDGASNRRYMMTSSYENIFRVTGPLCRAFTGDSPHKDQWRGAYWCAILIAHQIVMAKHGGSCVHFSGISTCGRTSRETVSHSQRQPFPTPHKIALPVYVTVTNKRLQPLTTTLCNSLVLSFSLLTTKRRLIKHRSFLCVLRSSQLCRRC